MTATGRADGGGGTGAASRDRAAAPPGGGRSVLLVYNHRAADYSPDYRAALDALRRLSPYDLVSLNTAHPFPPFLDGRRFAAVILHSTLFGQWPYTLSERHDDLLRVNRDAYTVAFFQDEYRFCRERFDLIDDHGVDCVFSLLDPRHYGATYRKHTGASIVRQVLPGYVSRPLLRAAERLAVPDGERPIDVSYRGSPMPAYMGREGQEKVEIARRFAERARGLDLSLDLSVSKKDRFYGQGWYRFLASSKACLGVEAGVSIFDLEGEVYAEYLKHSAGRQDLSYEELRRLSGGVVEAWEGRIPYRTIAPRHFEAAAFRVCQILFEGSYSGLLEPGVHYIPLRKDFSNFDQVVATFSNRERRLEIVENAHRDLIASGRYTYRTLVDEVNEVLAESGRPIARRGEGDRRLRLLLAGWRHLHRSRRRALHSALSFGSRLKRGLGRRAGDGPAR